MWHQVYRYNNLLLAFYKASKGKKQHKDVKAFAFNLNENIKKLAHQIQQFKVPLGNYSYFVIKDPKERTICAANFVERVYHHALMNIYHESFELIQIEHSYATRPNKGTHKAIYQTWLNCQKEGYWIKLDVKKFFDTINHEVLKKMICDYFEEDEIIVAFHQIIDSYNNETQIGLPIGNLTSQYFANFYLSFLDNYSIKELKIQKYIRYMDDIVIWSVDKDTIRDYFNKLTLYLEQELKQSFKPYVLNKTRFPIPYIGFLINNEGAFPNKRNRKKFFKKTMTLTDIETDDIAMEKYWVLHQFYNFKVNTYIKKKQPCFAGWQLEQQCRELPYRQSQQQQSRQSQQQQRVSGSLSIAQKSLLFVP